MLTGLQMHDKPWEVSHAGSALFINVGAVFKQNT
jgi:hypothetical protein